MAVRLVVNHCERRYLQYKKKRFRPVEAYWYEHFLLWTIWRYRCPGMWLLRFVVFMFVQPLMDVSMILSCGFLLGRYGEFFPHIYDTE